jgi:hypothetical protein
VRVRNSHNSKSRRIGGDLEGASVLPRMTVAKHIRPALASVRLYAARKAQLEFPLTAACPVFWCGGNGDGAPLQEGEGPELMGKVSGPGHLSGAILSPLSLAHNS